MLSFIVNVLYKVRFVGFITSIVFLFAAAYVRLMPAENVLIPANANVDATVALYLYCTVASYALFYPFITPRGASLTMSILYTTLVLLVLYTMLYTFRELWGIPVEYMPSVIFDYMLLILAGFLTFCHLKDPVKLATY